MSDPIPQNADLRSIILGVSPGRFVAFRMVPGTDLIVGLRAAQRTTGAGAIAVVTCVGSLTSVVLRHANRSVPTVYTGHFEITSLVGTVDRDGEHVHLTIADGEGRACGGHLMPGSQVYTTAEIVLLILDDLTFAREPCLLSGYDELVVGKKPQPRST